MVVMAVSSPISLSLPATKRLSCRLLSPVTWRGMDYKRSVSFLPQMTPSAVFFSAPHGTNYRPLSQQCKMGRVVFEVEANAATQSTWKTMILECDLPVLVEFWAPWCGPCRMIEPIIDEVAKQYIGRLKCFKINTDENPQVAIDYGVRSIPTVLLFRDGEKKESVIGAVPKSVMVKIIDKYLSS